jgi:hypothetical protein
MVQSRGTNRFSDEVVFGEFGSFTAPPSAFGTAFGESMMKPAGKPDAGNRYVRFDERGWETGRRFGVSARARPRLHQVAAA